MGNPNMMPPVGRGGLMPHDGRMSSGSQVPGQLGSSSQLPYPQGRYVQAPSPYGSYSRQSAMPSVLQQPGPPAQSSSRPGASTPSMPRYAQAPQQSPWLQQSAVSGQSQPLQQSSISQHPQPMQRSPWSRQVPQQVPQQSGPYSDSNPAAGVVATESQDHRFDLLPNRIVNIVFSVVSLFIMFLPGLSWGVGASGLRGKLILAVVLLVVGVVGIVYMLVKAVPRLRLAKDVGCGWKVGMSGRTAVVLTVIVLAAGGVLTVFTASDYSTGPVTDTVTFVERGTFSGSMTSAYYEFRTDSGRKFRISLANGDEGLMPSGLESGQRVTLTYYPRTGILVPDPAPTLAE